MNGHPRIHDGELLVVSHASTIAAQPSAYKAGHFAILLICSFFVGAMMGVIVETAWGAIRFGVLERRSGLLFFPFINPVYGAGAMILTIVGRKTKDNIPHAFIVSTICGATLEYTISLLQEQLTGSISWDYSDIAGNIGGRIHPLYCLAWGALGLLWISRLLPHIGLLARKLDTTGGRIMAIVAVLLVCFDLSCSAFAVHRWTQRTAGTQADTPLESYFDTRYDDATMRRYYPNLRILP